MNAVVDRLAPPRPVRASAWPACRLLLLAAGLVVVGCQGASHEFTVKTRADPGVQYT